MCSGEDYPVGLTSRAFVCVGVDVGVSFVTVSHG